MALKFDPWKCPECGEPLRGTIDVLAGCAEVVEPNADGRTDWTGHTDVWWDEQRSEEDDAGRVRAICHRGHEWWATQTSDDESFTPTSEYKCTTCLDGTVVNDTCDDCGERHCPACEPCV